MSARAAISIWHLSFLETGRARPSREMVLPVTATGDQRLSALYDELKEYPGVSEHEVSVLDGDGASRLMVTLRLKSPAGDLSRDGCRAAQRYLTVNSAFRPFL